MPARLCNCTVYVSLLMFVNVWARLWQCVCVCVVSTLYYCVFPQHMVADHSSRRGIEALTVGCIFIFFFLSTAPLLIDLWRHFSAGYVSERMCLNNNTNPAICAVHLRAVRSWPVSTLGSLPRSSSTSWVTPKGDSREKVSAALLVRYWERITDRLGVRAQEVYEDFSKIAKKRRDIT